jgi:photosynthetic reaction center H subunit
MTAPLKPAANHPGAPLVPTGNPLRDGVGPAAYADRPDVPDMTVEGQPKIRPISALAGFSLDARDPEPRGMPVYGADGVLAGTVREVWVNASEPQLTHLELELTGAGRRVLLPVGFAQIDTRRGLIRVNAILGGQFADVPGTKQPDRITLLEEDRIAAYFAGGYLYATPLRSEPIV